MEAPTVSEVLASCARLAVRLWVAVAVSRALMVGALGMMTVDEWAPHDRAAKLAAILNPEAAAPAEGEDAL